MRSKWNYLICGVNIAFAFFGALSGSLPLLLVGGVCSYWNWVIAEANKKKEDSENGQNNEEDQ